MPGERQCARDDRETDERDEAGGPRNPSALGFGRHATRGCEREQRGSGEGPHRPRDRQWDVDLDLIREREPNEERQSERRREPAPSNGALGVTSPAGERAHE